jgi:hypothetical protein
VTGSTRAVAAMQVHSVARILTFDAGDSDGKKIKVPAGDATRSQQLTKRDDTLPFSIPPDCRRERQWAVHVSLGGKSSQ